MSSEKKIKKEKLLMWKGYKKWERGRRDKRKEREDRFDTGVDKISLGYYGVSP